MDPSPIPLRPASGAASSERTLRREGQVPSRYRVHRLPAAKPTERGVLYRRGDERFLLVWPRVRRAFAAEVGEGTERRTVFDLVVTERGTDCVACRLDVPSGREAQRVAKAILLGIGGFACHAGLQALARDGVAGARYDDLDVFGESVLEAVRFG